MGFSAIFKSERIRRHLDGLMARATENLRPAAQAGAQVYYDEVRSRVPVSAKAHHTKGRKQSYAPGNLRDAIYQAYADKESTERKAVYRISYSKKKAFYGRFVERGTSRMAARPFVRPSYDAVRQAATQAARTRLREGLVK